ncbi:extracellular solute-binding protein [Pseudaeromonas sharmana]|uniref:Maltodextrin-binding protein n=1 Tax=Pseudaeromonas sharmana TaxID=328412 RepID=A0ABV8CQN0_9GAMM
MRNFYAEMSSLQMPAFFARHRTVLWGCLLFVLLILAVSLVSGLHGRHNAPPTLVIWSARGVPELQQLARRYQAKTGVQIKIEAPADFVARFELLAQQGAGPDIVIWAHDRFPGWYQAGLLEPVAAYVFDRIHCRPQALEALRAGESVIAYPLQMETLLLFWNPQLIATAPTDLMQLSHAPHKADQPRIGWEMTSAYYSWPYVTAGADGVLSAQPERPMHLAASSNTTVLHNLALLQRGREQGWLAADLSYEQVIDQFSRGQLAMMLGGPWDRQRLEQAGVHYRLAPVPDLAGQDAHPFFGVLAAGISTQSREKMLAREFIEQTVLTPSGMALYQSGRDAGLVACFGQASADPFSRSLEQGIASGVAMPGHSGMPLFWNSIQSALTNLFQQRLTDTQALQQAERRINRQP